MFKLALYLLFLIIVTVLCASIVPLFMLSRQKINISKRPADIYYVFSREVFEAEYPDYKYFDRQVKDYEIKRNEEYSIPLP